MLRRARDTMFWIGMNIGIKQLADNNDVYQQTKPCNSKEPLQQHGEGTPPWEKRGVNLFEFNQKYYLVTVDYFCNFFEIDVLTSHLYDRKCCDTLFEAPFCPIGHSEICCV